MSSDTELEGVMSSQPLAERPPALTHPLPQVPSTVQTQPPSAEELASLAKEGNRDALEALITMFEASIYRLCYRILGNAALAEDARQESFIRMIKAMPTFETKRRFSSWLYAIATHVSLDLVRSNRTATPAGPMQLDDGEEPLSACIQKENLARLDEALVLLSPYMRSLLALRFQEGLTPLQISKILSVTANQVRVDLFRARMELRRVLGLRNDRDEE